MQTKIAIELIEQLFETVVENFTIHTWQIVGDSIRDTNIRNIFTGF